MREIRIGIVGTGSIASRFARACHLTEGVSPEAVSSRSEENGRCFARDNNISRFFLGEEAMAASSDIDLVYVAVPHPAHFEATMIALRAGKPVLCEKPMAISRIQAETLFAEAKKRGVFLMEGMWTRFLPNTMLAKRWIDEGRIGRLRLIDGVFAFAVDRENPKPRLVKRELGGGAMFDVGVYTVEIASYFAGMNPSDYSGYCEPYGPGSDGTSVLALRYPSGVLATLRMGIDCQAQTYMTLYGEQGRIELPRFFSAPEARLIVNDEVIEDICLDCELPRGFTYQIAAVRDDLLAGHTKSTIVPPEDTIFTNGLLGEMMHRFFPDWY